MCVCVRVAWKVIGAEEQRGARDHEKMIAPFHAAAREPSLEMRRSVPPFAEREERVCTSWPS